VRGHLIDSMILSKIFDAVMDLKGEFEVLEFSVGKRKDEHSSVRLLVKADSREQLQRILDTIYRMGAIPSGLREASFAEAPADGVPPEGFYVTTNNPTQVYLDGRWLDARPTAANMVIVRRPQGGSIECRPAWSVRRGDLVLVGEEGVRVNPPERPREGVGIFEFMSGSAPRTATPSLISGLAEEMEAVRERGGRIVVITSSAIVRSGAADSLASLIRKGYVSSLISDGSLLTCDVELRLFGTCDGVAVAEGAKSGYGNRLRAAAELRRAGGLRGLVESGVLREGLSYELATGDLEVVLVLGVGDEPVPGAISDSRDALLSMLRVLDGAELVLALAGGHLASDALRLLSSGTKLVVVDVSPEAILRVAGMGIAQSVSVMSDVAGFLRLLDSALARVPGPRADRSLTSP